MQGQPVCRRTSCFSSLGSAVNYTELGMFLFVPREGRPFVWGGTLSCAGGTGVDVVQGVLGVHVCCGSMGSMQKGASACWAVDVVLYGC